MSEVNIGASVTSVGYIYSQQCPEGNSQALIHPKGNFILLAFAALAATAK